MSNVNCGFVSLNRTFEEADAMAYLMRSRLDFLYNLGCQYNIDQENMARLCQIAHVPLSELMNHTGEHQMSVYKAINAVQAELAKTGITKDRTNSQGSGYKFRGIDDVYNSIAPLLSKHGLCILPRVLSREVTERASKSGGALFYVVVEAEFDFVCTKDGSKHTVKTFGEAMDSGDKATNKAMSAAYKYAAFQAFSIPTESDNDADAHTHEVKPNNIRQPALGGIGNDLTADWKLYLEGLAADVENCVKGNAIGAARALIEEAEKENDLDENHLLYMQGKLSPTARKALGMTYVKAA